MGKLLKQVARKRLVSAFRKIGHHVRSWNLAYKHMFVSRVDLNGGESKVFGFFILPAKNVDAVHRISPSN